ncbi:MAG: hypothetical protein QF449_13420 [Alphaproteobacteria bacterium]|nr:hypothetical protein [Alphaproteobacteria bacterium]MDP6819023.1 hypothetical protein [Alphaproteobacteria bacterium]
MARFRRIVMRAMSMAALVGLFLLGAACDAEIVIVKPYDGEYAELKGKTVLVYFATDADELRDICARVIDTPWPTGGCANVGVTYEETLRMRENFANAAESGKSGIDCVLILPTGRDVLVHELSLCATLGKDYWHKQEKGGDVD